MGWFSGARTRLHLIFAPRAAEARAAEEMRFHLEMESARLAEEGRMAPEEARRIALTRFGGVTQHREQLRSGRGFAWLGGLSLDMKLGVRMLIKYPGLTIVGGLAMAFAIWVGAVTFEMVGMLVNPSLPLPNGDRIVQLRNRNTESGGTESRALYDYTVWRSALTTVTDIGAYRDMSFNVIGTDGDSRRESVAAITASGFRIASARPLHGRALIEADENPSAPPVIVLGYNIWRNRFAGDPRVVGRTVQLGDTYATVVGVMGEGFAFPIAHQLWIPLQLADADRKPGTGPALTIFGRLAPEASFASAQAELSVIGKRASADFPETHRHLRAQVAPFTTVFFEGNASDRKLMYSFNFFAVALLVLLCGNVALLLFARAATRESELIVRSALGATRGRIVAQLVAEALVLGGAACAVGLATAAYALNEWAPQFLEINIGTLPFWYQPHLSVATVIYAMALTVFGAIIAGAVPALKVTRGLGSRLKQGSAGGGGLQFGGVWTAVIVAQVALTVAFPAIVYFEQRELRRIRSFDVGFRDEQYLALRLDVEIVPAASRADTQAQLTRFGASLEAVRQRVASEPGVAGVTFVDRLPRMSHVERFFDVEDAPGMTTAQNAPTQQAPHAEVTLAAIDPSYFDVLETPIIAGRAFHAADVAPGANAVIVDQGFVDQVLGGRSAVGRRVRYAEYQRFGEKLEDAERPWFEIVGVAKELGMAGMVDRKRVSGLYFPAALSNSSSLNMIVHVRGDPLALAPKVREIAIAADPRLRLSEFQRMDKVADSMLWIIGMWLRITGALTAIALLVSLAGIYAVLSFTVARRTREIGVRVALGASRQRLVAAIFRRPLTQVGFGVIVGGFLVAGLSLVVASPPDSGSAGLARAAQGSSMGEVALLLAYVAAMFAVCLLACVVPTRRALAVEPTEALRAE